ncbi:hypothetical protein SAMN02799630_00063 [Paenibacillus sp. UNCCL117]|uniref:hypothetical protein n=1 Tax=unclassified Paenibacillus TaxID=185978 RepID=UPI0008815FEE|nr:MULTISPECIES: hypothetical protein [unclassified Paenibacillus]SDC54033.1 hypothetical protein SAMN04488602_102469 [Paenibacillus sp. cl123]SFW11109.1 hypothetical protein SAMN02799630_00063 [Paenibacillus sp. UNCCL117]
MFDPTIFDNLKVVMEGRLYDLDAEGSIRITGREDLIDLAALSRTFRMTIQPARGRCSAVVTLTSGLTDFAMERRIARPAELRCGAELQLALELPASYQPYSGALHDYLTRLWGEEADIRHTLSVPLLPSQGGAQLWAADAPDMYRIVIRFARKIDESHIEDLEQWLDIAAMGLAHVEERRNLE